MVVMVSELLPSSRPDLLGDANKLDWGELMKEALEMPGQRGNTYNRFYTYSFLNQLALSMQGVAEPVATYKRWQEMDRQVLKGSKAKAILRPVMFSKENEFGIKEQRIGGFKWVRCLFTLSETEGEDLPPYEPPEWSRARALASLAIQEIPYTNIVGNVQGYSTNREFAVNPIAAYPLKTTIHELGHIVLKHTVAEPEARTANHVGIGEFQAEATAYLTMNELGARDQMDPAESRAYIQTWLGKDRPDDSQMRAVFTATDQILKAGRSAPKDEPESE